MMRISMWRLALLLAVLSVVACSQVKEPSRPNQVVRVVREDSHQGLALHRAQDIAFRSLGFVGLPYVYGGSDPKVGFDCSGFVQFVYRDSLKLDLPRTAQQQHDKLRKLARDQPLRLGDLVFFAQNGKVFHVGIYVGEKRFVHAPRTGKNIALSNLAVGYWGQFWAGTARVL